MSMSSPSFPFIWDKNSPNFDSKPFNFAVVDRVYKYTQVGIYGLQLSSFFRGMFSQSSILNKCAFFCNDNPLGIYVLEIRFLEHRWMFVTL